MESIFDDDIRKMRMSAKIRYFKNMRYGINNYKVLCSTISQSEVKAGEAR